MTVKTVLINESGTTLKLTEANGGVYRHLATLQARTGKHTITCNNNATYREYWVGPGLEDGDDSVITITSDNCMEYQIIYITNDPDNPAKLALRQVNRRVKETPVVNQTGGDVKLIEKGGVEKIHVLTKGGKFFYNSAPGEAKDSTYELAKAQRINIDPVNPAKLALDQVKRGVRILKGWKGMFKGELKPAELPELADTASSYDIPSVENVHARSVENVHAGSVEKVQKLHSRYMVPQRSWDHVPSMYFFPHQECHMSSLCEIFEEMKNSGSSEIREIKTKDGDLSAREFEGIEGTPCGSSPSQSQSSTEFVNSVRDAFELKSDEEFMRMMKEEIGKLDYITNLLNPDYDVRETHETGGTCILFYFNEDYKLEFYFTTYEDMVRIIGVGLEHAKVILEKGRLLYVQEISRKDWQDALHNFDSTSSSMKVLVPQSHRTFIPNGRTLLFDLAKCFILKTVIASFHPNVVTYPNTVGGANLSVQSTNQNTPSSSSGSDSSRVQTLIEVVKNLWKGGFEFNAQTTKIQDTTSGSQKATTVFVRLLPGGELFNGGESLSLETIGGHLALPQNDNIEGLTSQLEKTILTDLEFTFMLHDNGEKKIHVDVGPVCFELDQEKGKDNFEATKRFGWFHRLMDASFQVADKNMAYLSSEHMALEVKEAKQTTTRSSTDETGSGTTYSGSLKVEGSVPQFGKIVGQGGIASSSSRSLSQTSGASGERNVMETDRIFSITSQPQHLKAKLQYTYTSENYFLLVCLLDSLRKSRIQSEDINQGRLPSYFWNGTFGTHFDCLSHSVKFQGTWFPRNQSESVKYTFEATREVEMTEKVELSKMIKGKSKSRFKMFSKSPTSNPNKPILFSQRLKRDLYLNHAMTHLSGLDYNLEEQVNQGQLGEGEPKTILKTFASGGAPDGVAVDLVDVNPKMQQQLVQAHIEAGSGLP